MFPFAFSKLRLIGFAGISLFIAANACKKRNYGSVASDKTGPEFDEYEVLRAKRTSELDSYLGKRKALITGKTTYSNELIWFRDFPVGNAGLPVSVYRVLPELLPKIWGTPESKMAKFGLGRHPEFDDYPLPLGIGWSQSSTLPANVGVFTCGTCHIGRVINPKTGRVELIYGAPNTQFDVQAFTHAVDLTVQDPNFTAKNIQDTVQDIKKKNGADWLYPGLPGYVIKSLIADVVVNVGAEKIVDEVKTSSLYRNAANALYLTNTDGPYNESNNARGNLKGGNPGQTDAFTLASVTLRDIAVPGIPLEMQAVPGSNTEKIKAGLVKKDVGMIDIPSVWGQNRRSAGQWDGSIKNHFVRNLGAEMGVVGDPTAINVENGILTTKLTGDLPPKPYPFAVNMNMARRGMEHYKTHCASCHKDNNPIIYKVSQLGTDPDRAMNFSEPALRVLNAGLKVACDTAVKKDKRAAAMCKSDAFNADYVVVSPFMEERGYIAHPLDGIWARAPYLHNGSIPTLMHLLVPELREKPEGKEFWRGNIAYDATNVGFEWRTKKAPQAFYESVVDPGVLDENFEFTAASKYDTTKRGASNKGHVGLAADRDGNITSDSDKPAIKWSDDPNTEEGKKTYELIEYLKTL